MRVFNHTATAIGAVIVALAAACGDSASDDDTSPQKVDPGTAAWELVPADQVRAECRLDPTLLRQADLQMNRPWAIVRYGRLCHAFYPDGSDDATEVFSATKLLGATVTGIAAYQTRTLERSGRKTGPLGDEDRVDHWLDEFDFNPEARVAHVLGMVAFNQDLGFGSKEHLYDGTGFREVNRLSDIINTAIAQDPETLGENLDEFTRRFLFDKLGMNDSVWSSGEPDKFFAFSWNTSLGDMARLGLLVLNHGVWSGERLLSEEWIYRMTHPSFEDANTGFGYLTWLASDSNHHLGEIEGATKLQGPRDSCSPPAISHHFPHGISEAVDCFYEPPWTCEQDFDIGVWSTVGLGGQLIVGHPGLDLVMVVKDLGVGAFYGTLWDYVRPAVIAADPVFEGDEEAFCAAYRDGRYAPDLG